MLIKTPEEYVELLRRYSHQYYNLGEPEITDSEFDELKDEFKNLYPDHAYFKEVGVVPSDPNFKKANHEIPMGSLDKALNEQEMREWAVKSTSDLTFCASEKIDGLSVSVTYWNGHLRQAITRGDGIVGDDITRNVSNMKIPKKLPLNLTLTLRGEIFLKKSIFSQKHSSTKANPRNAAVGLTKRLDGVGTEDLDIFFYDIISNVTFKEEIQKFEYIKNTLNLNTPFYKKVSLEELIKIHEDYENLKRQELDYEIDGLVVKVNSLSKQEILGELNLIPKFAVAYKFESQKANTVLEDVIWQVGRTGYVTPLAQVKPIEVGGVTISNVTLHNIAEIGRLGVKKGQLIEVKRSGDVIPKITRTVSEKGQEIKIPTNCPECESLLDNNGIQLRCLNNECPAKMTKGLLHWLETLDILNFGERLVEQLEERGFIKEPSDFYKLRPEHIASIEGRGQVIAQKVLDELHSKKKITLGTFLSALSIPNLSIKTGKLLASEFGNLEAVQLASEEQLEKVQGIAKKLAKIIVLGIKEKEKVINNLMQYVEIVESEFVSTKLGGKTFCFTGFRDKSLEQKIETNGGKVVSGVTSKLNYLVAVGAQSTKTSKAKELGVSVISPDDLKNLLDF